MPIFDLKRHTDGEYRLTLMVGSTDTTTSSGPDWTKVKVVIDTGSSDIWIKRLSLQTVTLKGDQDVSFSVRYGDGQEFKSKVVRGRMRILGSDKTIEQQVFGKEWRMHQGDELIRNPTDRFDSDGLVGFGLPGLRRMNISFGPSFLPNLFDAFSIPSAERCFTLKLPTYKTHPISWRRSGFAHFGKINNEEFTKYPELRLDSWTVPVVPFTGADTDEFGFWAFNCPTVHINGVPYSRGDKYIAIADSGSAQATMAKPIIDALYNAIPGSRFFQANDGGTEGVWKVKPSQVHQLPRTFFAIFVGTKPIYISPEDILMRDNSWTALDGGVFVEGAFQAQPAAAKYDLLGVPFMKNCMITHHLNPPAMTVRQVPDRENFNEQELLSQDAIAGVTVVRASMNEFADFQVGANPKILTKSLPISGKSNVCIAGLTKIDMTGPFNVALDLWLREPDCLARLGSTTGSITALEANYLGLGQLGRVEVFRWSMAQMRPSANNVAKKVESYVTSLRFNNSYKKPPIVTSYLIKIDAHNKGEALRIKATASDITTTQFNMNLGIASDSIIQDFTAYFVVQDADDAGVRSGTYCSPAQLSPGTPTIREMVNFTTPFKQTPRYGFCGLNYIEWPADTPLRVACRLNTFNKTLSDFEVQTWGLKSDDYYRLGGSWMVFQ